MKITWDEPKRLKNLKRGYDFASLTMEFFEAATVYDAKEGRFMALGMFEGHLIAVVFKPLGSQGLSVISMRRASTKERKLHAKA